jgi:hypothetical protein
MCNSRLSRKETNGDARRGIACMFCAQAGKQMKLEGGTIAEDVVVGSGAAAKPGKHVGVYYVGRTAHNNKVRGSACIGEARCFGPGDSVLGNVNQNDVVGPNWALAVTRCVIGVAAAG